jgi:hypothetical protein
VLTLQGDALGATTLRVDAPKEISPRDYAQALVHCLAADDAATAAVLVIYTDETREDGKRPYWEHVEALTQELAIAEMPLKDAWIITAQNWKNYLCEDRGCCSLQPLETITDSKATAALVYQGGSISGYFTAPDPFFGDPNIRIDIEAAVPSSWPENMDSIRAQWSQILGSGSLTADTALELAGAFQHPIIRDYLMIDSVGTAKDQFTAALLGHVSSRPDWTRVLRAQEQAFELMKFTPEGQRAPMLCLIGWLEWLKGQSSFAARYFKLAIDDVEDFHMAVLLAELVNKGMVAEVARNKHTAYRHKKQI